MEKTISEVVNYISSRGGSYSDWYAGIASDPKDRLFNDHRVDEKADCWIFRDCGSDGVARNVERHFLAKRCQGGDGGGDYQTKYFYAYKVKPHTHESDS